MPDLNGSAVVFIGTYTEKLPHVAGKAEGIYAYRLDRTNGTLSHLSTTSGVINPSFVAVSPDRRYLYAVQEVGEYEGLPGGMVNSFAIDPETFALKPLNQQRTFGTFPCYVSTDGTGRWVLIANHGGGNVTVLPVGPHGELGEATAVVAHQGTSAEDVSHPHSIIASPDSRFVLVADAGLSRVYVYRLDPERGTLEPNDEPWVALPAGTGPRHMVFHPSGNFLYTVNERGSSVTAFAYDAAQGTLRELQTLSTLPAGWSGRNACADIHIDPTGQFLYGSNRGHNSLALFTVDPSTGTLQAAGHTLTDGRTPRGFGIEATGSLVLAANQDTDTIVPFALDPTTGALGSGGPVADIPTPVCLCIVEFPA